MARSNGPFGPGGTRAPARRLPTDDPFAPPAGQGGGHNTGWPPAPYPDQGGQQGQGYHFPPEPEQNAYGQHQGGYAQSPPQQYEGYANGLEQPSYPPQQWAQHPDPRGYDLGNYMPATSQPYPPADPGPFRQGADRAYGGSHQGYADTDSDYADDEFADMDEPRRGRRWMFVAAAALVGAVGVGGALAYTYKSLFAPSAGRVPVVKAEQGTRAKPSDKSLTRLNDDASKQAPGSEQQDDRVGDDGGPRRVKTIAINPGAPGMVPAAQAQAPEVSPSVPGIMLDVRPRAPQAAPPKGAQPSAPQSPRVSIGVPPANLAQQQAQPEVDAPPPPKRAAVAVAQPPPAAKPPARPASPTPAAAAPSTGSGYVAVLSSQKSRLDALKIFADLQQKYPDALSNKVPDVQEKDLSERGLGTMFRLVVGPPGSRQAASGVCSQLKSAGHEGCWVTEY
jgi:hypothetical protein